MTNKTAICQDDSHTWRTKLTAGKAYEVIRLYSDPHAGYDMIDIVCDDGQVTPYRADRFTIQD